MKNTFKYRCADCGQTQYEHRRAFIRAFRPRCNACGSPVLDPVTDTAKDRASLGQAAKTEQETGFDQKQGIKK